MSAATWTASCATWSRPASPCCATASRKDVQAKAELAAEERLLTALVGEGASSRDARQVPQDAARRRAGGQGGRGRGGGAGPVAIGQIDLPGMPPGQMVNLGEMMKGMFGGSAAEAPHDGGRRPHRADARGERPAARHRRADQGRGRSTPSRTASSSSTRSTRSAPAAAKAASAAATCPARACSATCCR